MVTVDMSSLYTAHGKTQSDIKKTADLRPPLLYVSRNHPIGSLGFRSLTFAARYTVASFALRSRHPLMCNRCSSASWRPRWFSDFQLSIHRIIHVCMIGGQSG